MHFLVVKERRDVSVTLTANVANVEVRFLHVFSHVNLEELKKINLIRFIMKFLRKDFNDVINTKAVQL